MSEAIKVASLFGVLELKDTMSGDLDKAEGRAKRFGSFIAGGFKTALIAGAAGFGVLATGIGLSLKNAMEAEVGLKKMEAILKATGGAAGKTSAEIQRSAAHWAKLTRFSDDAVISAEAMLLTFREIKGDTFDDATRAALNMAEMFGTDATQAAMQLGKALNDPIGGVTALRRVGVALNDQQEEQIKKFMEVGDVASAQRVIIQELEAEFGGLAVAAGDTASGKLTIFKNRIMEVFESVGMSLLPPLIDLADIWLPKLAAGAEDFGIKLSGAFASIMAAYQESGMAGLGDLLVGGLEKALGISRPLDVPAFEVPVVYRPEWELDTSQMGRNPSQIQMGFSIVDPEMMLGPSFEDTVATRAVEIGKALVQGLADGIGNLGQWAWEHIKKPIGDALVSIDPGVLTLIGVGLGFMTTVTIVEGLTSVATGLNAITVSAWATLVPMAPLIVAFAVIGGIVLAYQTNFLGARDAIDDFGEALRSITVPQWLYDLYDALAKIHTEIKAVTSFLGAGGSSVEDRFRFDSSRPGEMFDTLSGMWVPYTPNTQGATVTPTPGGDFMGAYTGNQPIAVGTGAQPELFVPGASGGMHYPAGTWPTGGGAQHITIMLDSATLFEGVVNEGQRRNVTIYAGAG